MTIKRAFYAMLVLLLPLTALAQPTIPTPAQGTAIIAVSKYFTNGEGYSTVGEPVNLRIQCDGGSIAPSNAIEVIHENGKYEAAFVVFNLGEGQTTECKVWEEPIDGFTSYYYCDYDEYEGYTGAGADPSCLEDEEGPSVVACQFNTVTANVDEDPTPGSQAGCTIVNFTDAVEVELTKVWEVFGHPGDDFSDAVNVQFTCDAPIFDGYTSGDGYYRINKYISSGSYVDGMATVVAYVYPDWYADDETTTCWVNEYNVASGVEVDQSDCQGLSVPIGSEGVGCTITNTMFFEGIPTLNQYGMAILALLMLGVGFVGFRRFV